MNSYRELAVWQRGVDIAKTVYQLTAEFPRTEQYDLTSQFQRAAVSIPANIAEGHARDSTKDFLRHLSIARGSLAELETLLMLAKDFGYVANSACESVMTSLDEISRMLRGLQKAILRKLNQQDS